MVATSTPEAPYLQDPCSTWSRVRGTPGPEDGSQPGVSPVGLLGMEGRGLEGGSSGSAGCAGGSALLPASSTGNGVSTGRASGHLVLCVPFVLWGDPWRSPRLHLQTESSSRLGPFLISHLRPQGLLVPEATCGVQLCQHPAQSHAPSWGPQP